MKKLLEVTEQALYVGIEQMVVGNRVGDISAAIQRFVEDNGFCVVRSIPVTVSGAACMKVRRCRITASQAAVCCSARG